jgi:glycosyltransferase involved in cell wall biosynthesis
MEQQVYKDQRDLRLHLGCGQVRLEGYVNIDRDPEAKADIFIDAMDLCKVFSASSVAEVQMYHILNYLSLWDARKFFTILFKLLQPNGKICLETVNIERTMQMIQSSSQFFPDYLEGVRSFHAFGNDHLEAQLPYYPNAFSWTPWHLKAELELAGFAEVEILPSQTHHPFRDMRIEAKRSANPLLDRLIENQRVDGKEQKPSVLFLLDPELGHTTVQVRGLIHEELFKENGWNVEFVNVRQVSENEIVEFAKNFDLVYLLKVASLALVERLKSETNCKVIFDLTDALWKPYHVKHGWQDLDAILKKADYIFSENEYICEYGRKFNAVYSVPAVTHPEKLDKMRASLNKSVVKEKVRIGWVGSTGTVQALLNIQDVLVAILKKYPEVELRIVGCKDNSLLAPFDGLNVTVRGDYNEQQMLEELVTFDIGIYPAPVDEEDYALRGAQKAMLYMQAGVPPVALAVGDCATIIRDGINGMLVFMKDDWMEKLERMIANPILRKQMGDRASADIGHNHSHGQVFQVLTQGFKMVASL